VGLRCQFRHAIYKIISFGDLWFRSQTIFRRVSRLRLMGVKYYTHFVLTGTEADESDQEFSGVVEVSQATEELYDPRDIEALLAQNFDLQNGDLRLINWSRLQ
jgi:hypothetical protein